MILCHDVVQVLLLPEPAAFEQWPRLLEGLERRGLRRVLLHGDDTRWDRRACPKGLAEKPLGGLGVSRRTQQQVEGMALGIDGPVEVVPRLLKLDVCCIDPVRVIGGLEMGAAAFVQFGRIWLDPTKDGSMVNVQPPLQHDCFQIAITEGVAQLSADAEHTDFAFEMAPFQQWGMAHGRSPVI
jgi:hypothetical protein